MGVNYINNSNMNSNTVPAPLNLERAFNLIIERANHLVSRIIEKKGHEKPPFSPEEFVHLKGIKKVIRTDLGNTSAVLLKYADGAVIKVNSDQPLVRQNFSCAHEIGHMLFDELKLERYVTNIEYRTHNPQALMRSKAKAVERLCDVAVTELLMPEVIFRKYLLNFGISINSVRQLADLFRVSVHTAAIRFSEVSPEPCIAFFWGQPKNKPNSLQLDHPRAKLFQKNVYTIVHQQVTSSSVIYKEYEHNDSFKCIKRFKVNNQTKDLTLESKGFGHGEFRYVLSLAYPDRKKI